MASISVSSLLAIQLVHPAEGTVFGPRAWKTRKGVTPDAVAERIRREREAGRTYRAIAEGLNEDDVPTAQGGAQWWPATVRQVLARA